jgi:hypothetical protein
LEHFLQERRALLAELLWGPGPPLLEIMSLWRRLKTHGMGKKTGKSGKIMGKTWGNHEQIISNWRFIDGKIMGNDRKHCTINGGLRRFIAGGIFQQAMVDYRRCRKAGNLELMEKPAWI